jgi:hypothetical protein
MRFLVKSNLTGKKRQTRVKGSQNSTQGYLGRRVMKALVATSSSKMLRIIYCMLRDKQPYHG